MVKVSVIIPSYNVEKYIGECLDSVINQTLEDLEIICINDGSTDDTLKILETYADEDCRIRIIDQNNRGLSASRNIGITESKGDYICFLDSDDLLPLDALEKFYDICEEKSLDFVIAKLINFDDETKEFSRDRYFDMPVLKKKVGENVFSHQDIGDYLYKMNVTAPGKLYRADFIRDIRFPEGLIFEDNVFFTEIMLKAKRVFFIDEDLYYRRIRPSSITNAGDEKFYDWVEINNLLIKVTKEYGFYEEYRYMLFKRKIFNSYYHFSKVCEEYKEGFFERIKADFMAHQEEYEADEVFQNMREKEKTIFRAGINSLSYREFELTVKNFDLSQSNKKLQKNNRKLKRNIKSYEEKNNEILDSRSWKATKPFRKFKTYIGNR